MPAFIDLTGERYGQFLILERDREIQKQKNSKDTFWKCQCDCGTIFSARGHDIRQNKILSCGCLKRKNTRKINFIDLTGQKFGKLTVISESDYKPEGDGHTRWNCQCECGNTCIVSGKQLRSGQTKSCGCLKSSGELKIIEILYENQVEFQTQKTFEGCKHIQILKFDFYLPKYNTVIEYNGVQHYEPIEFLGGEERFKQQQINDGIKKKWCQEHGIHFVEISYKDYEQIDYNYLINKIKGEK